jgi:hypothetical protein
MPLRVQAFHSKDASKAHKHARLLIESYTSPHFVTRYKSEIQFTIGVKFRCTLWFI